MKEHEENREFLEQFFTKSFFEMIDKAIKEGLEEQKKWQLRVKRRRTPRR